jgi:hypothetical protein
MRSESFLATIITTLLVGCGSDTRAPGNGSDTTHASAGDTAAADTPAASATAANHLTAEGWGPLRIGMSRAEVVAAAGDDANPNAVGGPEPGQCDEFRPARTPQGLLVMIESDTLTRISVSDNRGITTPNGLHVGDSAATVLRAYGARAEVMPHKYVEAPARYITVWENSQPGKARRGIRFEIDATEKVELIHAGSESIQYVEGCL